MYKIRPALTYITVAQKIQLNLRYIAQCKDLQKEKQNLYAPVLCLQRCHKNKCGKGLYLVFGGEM